MAVGKTLSRMNDEFPADLDVEIVRQLTRMDPNFRHNWSALSATVAEKYGFLNTYPTFENPVPLSQMMGAR